DVVTRRVANWSDSGNWVRVDVKFSATYATDPRKTLATATRAAASVPRVLKNPAPVCHVLAFGGSAIEYELWFWIDDAAAGLTSVRSGVMLALWDTFE